jgi:predicted porin
MQSVLIVSSVLLLIYGIWFLKNIITSGKAKRIHREYQALLDQKLLLLGFKKTETVVGGREKIAHYKRNILEVTLSYEISFDTNRILLANEQKSKTLNLTAGNETRSNIIQILEKWLVKNQ